MNVKERHRADLQSLDQIRIRKQFPILEDGLCYLDSAASAQKPLSVIQAVDSFYRTSNANIHRGVYRLSVEATRAYDESREKVRQFLNARSTTEVVFVRGVTEAINLVASSFGRQRIGAGDEILLTEMEHHSNIVPWQLLAEEKGAQIKVLPVNEVGELQLERLDELLSERCKLLALCHVSNALGTINPVRELIAEARKRNIPVLLDGAQAAPHIPVDVQELDCDFYAFSGHKAYGPTGIGVLYGKQHLLEEMPPYHGGGDMIELVSFSGSTYRQPPEKFEAGTPNIAGAIGLGAALDFISDIGFEALQEHEAALREYAEIALRRLPGLRLIGTAQQKVGVCSFVLEQAHPHDIATILDRYGVAVRAGHHCAQPLMERYGVPATTRASLAVYNTEADIDRLVEGLQRCISLFE